MALEDSDFAGVLRRGIEHFPEHLQCPVTFVFVERDEPGVYDAFRLSAVSYLEHHNQVRRQACD